MKLDYGPGIKLQKGPLIERPYWRTKKATSMRREQRVPHYRWVQGYTVVVDGWEQLPPLCRAEAIQLAKKILAERS